MTHRRVLHPESFPVFPLFITSVCRACALTLPRRSPALCCKIQDCVLRRKPRQASYCLRHNMLSRWQTIFYVWTLTHVAQTTSRHITHSRFSVVRNDCNNVVHARPVSSCYSTLADCSNCTQAAAPNTDTTLQPLLHMR